MDDEPTMRDTLGAALSKLGHVAEVVESAEAALEVFDGSRFDLAIVDLYLPGMNGDQLARIIKRQDGQLPIILLTAYPPAEIPADIDLLLLKPFTVESLKESISRARCSGTATSSRR